MEVVTLGPLPVASMVWQPRPGVWILTVVVKATYVLRPGEASLAPLQEAPADDERYWSDDPTRSLRAPRDLVPVKPNAEVLLVGHAFASDHQPVRSLVARLVVGDFEKSVEVLADRFIGPDGSVREGAPFARMPLTYERAAGGPGTTNPVGVARSARDAQGRVVLPNLQRPGAVLGAGAIEPIGFGPLAPTWPERSDRLRGVNIAGATQGFTFRDIGARPLPEGMDLGFFNAAPRDQQVRALGESEHITLENLHPEHARLVTTLPGIAPRTTLEGRRSGPVTIPMRADTLWIDTDRGMCTLTFRGMIPLEGVDEVGRVTVVMEGGRTGDEAGTSGVMRAPRHLEMTADVPLAVRQGAPAVMPFTPATVAAVPSELPSPRALQAMLSDAARLQAVHSPWASSTPRIEELPSAPGPSPAPRPASVPGVLDASNAAAGALASVLRFEASPARTTSAAEPRQAPRVEATDALELVWFDVESTPRLRRKAAFRAILLALEKKPLDPDFDDPALAKEPMLVEDRREVFEILARAEPTNHAALDATLARCLREDGKFVPAIALFSGELELPFDEVAALRATLSTVTPFVGTDDALRAAVDTARELLALPELIAAPAVVEGLTRRIEDAFAQGKRAVPVGYLEAQRERVLLEQRRYQRRAVFGDKFLRAVLRLDGEATAKQTAAARASANPGVPAYLPPSVADLLPLASRFRARLVAEIRLGADPAESHPAALKVLALVRAVARAPR